MSSNGDSSPETDHDFDPSAEMLIHDYDDEQTIEEEENYNVDSSDELDDLKKEGDMPIEDLLAMYAGKFQSEDGNLNKISENNSALEFNSNNSSLELSETHSNSENDILINQDLTLDKEEIARDILKGDLNNEDTTESDLLHSVNLPSQTVRLLRSTNYNESDEETESDDECTPASTNNWKKTISVGSDFQAVIPEAHYSYGDTPAYENEDRLLWNPEELDEAEVESFLYKVYLQATKNEHENTIPVGTHIRDDEQALFLLLQCGLNVEEALRRKKMQAAPTGPMSLWSEEECRNFELGLRLYGKNFYQVQGNKVRTRSVSELVQFYYLWKKTERHDVFANKTRLEKKKYIQHPGITDYMERLLDEQENFATLPTVVTHDTSSTPNVSSILYADSKRQVVDIKPNEVLELVHQVAQNANIKLNSELITGNTTIEVSGCNTVEHDLSVQNSLSTHSSQVTTADSIGSTSHYSSKDSSDVLHSDSRNKGDPPSQIYGRTEFCGEPESLNTKKFVETSSTIVDFNPMNPCRNLSSEPLSSDASFSISHAVNSTVNFPTPSSAKITSESQSSERYSNLNDSSKISNNHLSFKINTVTLNNIKETVPDQIVQ